LKENIKIYFVSDAHLGMDSPEQSLQREKLLVRWLDEIRKDATEIYLLGDMFDYWFEYRKVVPRGFTRFIGKIAEITDAGIPVYYFIGNHDVWIFDYLPEEAGIKLCPGPITKFYHEKKFFIAHGDGLGPDERSHRFLMKITRSRILQWLFARIHPNFATALAQRISRRSRYAKGISVEFLGPDKEDLFQFAREKLKTEHFDFFIFGHRHIPMEYSLNENSKLILTGDWIIHFTYAVFDGEKVVLKRYQDD
jgi:UDP-2,3-diacylglucosamine hydrolase